jgi:hypothetical protein
MDLCDKGPRRIFAAPCSCYLHGMPRDREWSVKFWFILGAGLVLLYWLVKILVIWQATPS